MKNNKIELLSPAGDMLSLKGAVNNGCDAVYLGGENFNARSSAENFTNEEIREAVQYCSLRGIEVFLVVNILYKENELEKLYNFLSEMYEIGISAFIVQDIGIGMFIKKNFKGVKLHASTQLNAHSLKDVIYLQSLGFDRVILAREVPLKEIKQIKEKVNIEIEVFGHGALCISHSGQCLMSSFIGGRSGNRGKCAGTCRLEFDFIDEDGKKIKSGYLLSAKDLMTLETMKELANINIDSIKLEGRMKSYEYVSLTTKLYKEQINTLKGLEEEDKKQITQIFNRGGELSTGFLKEDFENLMSIETPKSTGLCIGYVRHYSRAQNICTIRLEADVIPGDGIEIWTQEKPNVGCGINKEGRAGEDISVVIKGKITREDKVYKSFDKGLKDILKNSHKGNRRQPINCIVEGLLGKPLKITVIYKDKKISSQTIEKIDQALKKPLEKEKILEKLGKTGNSPFEFKFKEVNIDDNIFIPITVVNDLKRDIVEKLETFILDNLKRKKVKIEYKNIENEMPEKKFITVEVPKVEMLGSVIKSKPYRIYLEYKEGIIEYLDKYSKECEEKGIEFFIAFPKISNSKDEEKLEVFIKQLETKKIKVDGFSINNFGQKYLTPKKYKICYDQNFNIFNSLSNKFFTKKDNKFTTTLSLELSIDELKEVSNKHTEIVIHGKMPMMINRQCPVGMYVGDKKSLFCKIKGHTNNYYLVDRKEEKFLVKCYCDSCYVHIMQNNYIFTLNNFDRIRLLKSKYFKIVLTDENNIENLIGAYKKALDGHINGDSVYKKVVEEFKEKDNITYGHMFKGVL